MKITVNGRVINEETIEDALNLSTLLEREKVSYDVWLVNGFVADENTQLNDGDEVVLIKKGVMPDEETLETLMCGRHTPKIHKKLKQSTVAIFGLGGLGSNVATALARIGVGTLLLIDFDVVEPSNLNRQAYEISDIGKEKCQAMAELLHRINPYNTYLPINQKVEKEDVVSLVQSADVVVEAFDQATYKAMLVNVILSETDKPIVSASGMAGLYNPNTIVTKKVMKRLYLSGDGVHEAKAFDGLMAPRVLIAAGHQATVVCQLLLDEVTL